MTRGLLALLLAAALAVTGCGAAHKSKDRVVGARPDPQSKVLAELYAGALRSYGAPARIEVAADPLTKLDTGGVSVMPGFTGRLLQTFQPGATPIVDANVYRALVAALPEGIAAGDYTPSAEDKPAVAVTAATATAWGGRDLTALVRHCGQVTPGMVTGFRPPTHFGGCTPAAPREFPDDTALFGALRAGAVNVAWTSTADPAVPGDVVVLADRRPPLIQAENVVPLYRRNGLGEREVLAINEVAGEFDTAALTDMRREVAAGADPRQVAQAWLAAHPLGR